jgi:hypothetical protein
MSNVDDWEKSSDGRQSRSFAAFARPRASVDELALV